jgi:putative transposase
MDEKGSATDNVYIERFFRTIKYDKIHLVRLETGNDLYAVCEQFINRQN